MEEQAYLFFLRGLKKYPLDITAIVTVADDGGSSGKIRSDMNIPSPGDIRNVIAALSDVGTIFGKKCSSIDLTVVK